MEESSSLESSKNDIPNLDLSGISDVEVVEGERPPPPFSSPKPSKEPKLPVNPENRETRPHETEERPVNKFRPLTKKEEDIANRLYMEALAHNARMQDIQGRRHDECTFHPDLSLSQSITPSVPTAPATKRLYEEAAARKAREYDRSLRPPEGCSFKPTITPQRSHSPELPSGENGSGTKAQHRGRPSTPTRLYESSKQKNEKLEALKKKVEHDRLAECTFRPSTSRPLKSHQSTPNMTPDRPPPAERLYNDAKQREERQAMKAKQLLEEEKAKIEREKAERIRGGIPNAAIKEKEKIEIHGTFQDRARDSDLRINQKLKNMKAELHRKESEECTFKPQLTTRPASAGVRRKKSQNEQNGNDNNPQTPVKGNEIKRETPASVPVYLRLLNQGEELKKKKLALREHAEQLEKEVLTFRPSLATAHSPRARSPSPQRGGTTTTAGATTGGSQASVDLNVSLDVSHFENNQDITPLRPLYNLGSDSEEPSHHTPVPSSSSSPPHSPSKQSIPFYERLKQSGEEYKKKQQEMREKYLDSEKEALTFQPVLVRSPYSTQYSTSTANGHTMSPEGVLDNISVFERLSLAAQQKAINEAKALEMAKKEFPFQPVLHARAKSVPKRRKPEEINVPIYDRLIQAGVRRKTILLQSAKEKEDEELAKCTFQPTIPKESEALAVKAFAEEYQQFLKEQQTIQREDQNDDTHSQNLDDESTPRLERSFTPPLPNEKGGEEGLRRTGSVDRLVRRGSIFDRLNKQGIHNASFSEMSTNSIILEGEKSIHTTPPHDAHSDTHSTTSGSTHRSAPIRRDSMLLRPTISSAKKEKDKEEEDQEHNGAQSINSQPQPVKTTPIRRNSLLFNPTESSRLKDLHASPLPPPETKCHEVRTHSAPVRSSSAPPTRTKSDLLSKSSLSVEVSPPPLPSTPTPPPKPVVKSPSLEYRNTSPVSPTPNKTLAKKPMTSTPNSPNPQQKKGTPTNRQPPAQPFNPQKIIQRKKTPPVTSTTPTEVSNEIEEPLSSPPETSRVDNQSTEMNQTEIEPIPPSPPLVTLNHSVPSIVLEPPPLPPPSSTTAATTTIATTTALTPAVTTEATLQHSNSLARSLSTEAPSSASHSPALSPRTPRSIDTSLAQANTDKAREAIAALQRSLKGGLGEMTKPPASPQPQLQPQAQIQIQGRSEPQSQPSNSTNELSGSLAQQLFAQINDHFDDDDGGDGDAH